MIAALLAATLFGASMTDPVGIAQAQFERTTSYRATVRVWSAHGARSEIRYAYRKPGYVRMDFVTPHRGAVLVYDPLTRKVRLRPFGAQLPPVLSLSPTHRLLRDPNGHRVDQSDVGQLLRNVRALQQGGATVSLGEAPVGTRAALHVSVAGAPGHRVAGVHRYELWLDAGNGFPLKVESYADDDTPLETVTLDDVELDVAFPEHFFDP